MIRIETNLRGQAWRLIGTTEDHKQGQAQAVIEALANLTGQSTRLTRGQVHAPFRVISHCEPKTISHA